METNKSHIQKKLRYPEQCKSLESQKDYDERYQKPTHQDEFNEKRYLFLPVLQKSEEELFSNLLVVNATNCQKSGKNQRLLTFHVFGEERKDTILCVFFFVHADFPFLGASPNGVINENFIDVKCQHQHIKITFNPITGKYKHEQKTNLV